ncbi:MAG: TonB-dependent hemoglobin/transferrin/lactoferrin family receptor [Pseudomonadota bacterium]|nr:TonB-dependent hemoglobin/transferrin/lactoferrin family receptor [Pseudomonadota bacterium]
MRHTRLSLALRRCLSVVLCLPVLPALAADDATVPADNLLTLDRVVISATHSERALKDVPGTVDVIDRERMDVHLVRDIRDLVRYEPGISVTAGYGRFGLGGFRIRGLDGNRVLMQTDGINVSDAFAIGSYASANRNFVDLDTLKRVEIVRGPASALYGSDALAGVVAFTSKDPQDYMAEGKNSHVGFKLGYDGSWNGLFAGASTAFVGERFSAMVALGHRQGQATKNMGSNTSEGALRTAPNPQSRDGRSVLAKLGFAPAPGHRLMLTLEGNEDDTDTDVLSALGYSAMTRWTVSEQHARDHQSRARVSLAHQMDDLDGLMADQLHWQIYRQDSQTTQQTWELRHNAAAQRQRRERLFDFDQRTEGLQLRASKSFDWGTSQHRIGWGVEAKQSRIQQKRDGSQTNLLSGVVSNVVYPDVFPVRDFPNSRIREIGLYVQDEMELLDGRLSLIPGLRLDHYRLTPKVDDIFAEDNPGMAVAGINDTRVSPKLGAVWRMGEQWSLYGNYAQGFRAPPFNDVNLGFTNVQGGYAALPNADLKPETSRGLEVGVRRNGEALWLGLAGYYNDYRDFIESQVYVGRSPEGLMLFQSRNVRDAAIWGAEAKAGLDFGKLDPRLQGLSLRAALAWARGQDRSDDLPLASIDPLRASIGLAYEKENWGVELAASGARRKDRVAATAALPEPWLPPGYAVFDLLTHINFAPGATLNVGVFNLGDRRYADWAGVPGVSAASAVLERYSLPGRHIGISVSAAW